MTVATMQNDIRVGVQVIVEGERLEIEKFLALLTLFLQMGIPSLIIIADFFKLCMGVIDGVKDAFVVLPKFDFTPIGKQDFLIVYIGMCLIGVLIDTLIGVMIKND